MVRRIAQKKRILTLHEKQHFVDSGSLTLYCKLAIFRGHITSCVLCMAKIFVWEICVDRTTNKDTLFPFDELVEVCPDCEASPGQPYVVICVPGLLLVTGYVSELGGDQLVQDQVEYHVGGQDRDHEQCEVLQFYHLTTIDIYLNTFSLISQI